MAEIREGSYCGAWILWGRVALLFAMMLTAPGCMREQDGARGDEPEQTHLQTIEQSKPRVLLFSKTTGYRHECIPVAVEALTNALDEDGFQVVATEDAEAFSEPSLKRFAVVVFLCTTGDVLNEAEQQAMEQYIHGGGGFVGIHSAADTEYDWPWYGDLVGAYFKSHPKIQEAEVRVEDRDSISTRHLPERWTRTDEWYNYRTDPRET
ncbi:MAG TPA: ThuA domain-containing protein, partial [Phycisphaerales bacterium]|nr:ThuA domain-containing protein [Phycisphaerales bacterium]